MTSVVRLAKDRLQIGVGLIQRNRHPTTVPILRHRWHTGVALVWKAGQRAVGHVNEETNLARILGGDGRPPESERGDERWLGGFVVTPVSTLLFQNVFVGSFATELERQAVRQS